MSEILYNNIELPEVWPPRYDAGTLMKGMPVPYLDNPPEVIDISVGRQLFVDDFLVECHNLYRVYHQPKKYEGNPVMFPETKMEKYEKLPCAVPKDGGVWFDRDEKIYKMWYEAGWLHKMAYATSKDGIHWERPDLDVVPGTNEILADRAVNSERFLRPDSTTVFIDYDADPSERYKLFMRNPGGNRPGISAVSADGIHFDKFRLSNADQGDRSTAFYNPFRKKWVYSIRAGFSGGRDRFYAEHADFLEGASWKDSAVNWMCVDKLDKPHAYIGDKPEMYNFNAIAYESIMLGMFQIYYGPNNSVGFKTGAPKITELQPCFSRDGFHFSRTDRSPFIQAEMKAGTWDRGYVQSVGGGVIVKGDELWIYYIGFAGDESKGGTGNPNDCQFDTMYANGATGIAILRRDGFASLGVENDGFIRTRKLTFKGKRGHFFVNAETEADGCVKAMIKDEKGNVLCESRPFCGDSTCAELDFGNFDLASLEDKVIKLEFYIGKGRIYSFWFSESENGESGGFDGAGTDVVNN